MTPEEAQKIVDDASHNYYIDIDLDGDACLDGWFTIEQLEAIIVLIRSAIAGSKL